MKKLICILVLFFPGIAFSQQWRPVTSIEKFNYQIDTAGYISNVISVDSFSIQNNDTLFYLNRIVTRCAGCPDTVLRLFNQPQFLERKMTRNTGGIYMFSDPGKFWIKTLAGLNATWVFDSLANITAQVTSKTYELVLNQWDSVKTISLSNGEMIRLSKGHGIIQFPLTGTTHYYTLEGIAGRNLGVLVPGFHEFFNFNVGDVFQYHGESMSYGTGDGGGSLTKNRIISKDSTSSGYNYGIIVTGMSWYEDMIGYHGDSTHFYYTSTEIFTNSPAQPCNIDPQGIVSNPPGVWDSSLFASIMKIYIDTGQAISRQMGAHYFYPPELYTFGGGDTLVPNGANQYVDKYTVGLGRVDFEYDPFESYVHYELIGYVKNGDTIGTVYPDNFLLQGIAGTTKNDLIHIFPNPSKDKLTVEIPELSGNNQLSISTIEGQLLILRQIKGIRTTIDISNLPAGVYFVRLNNDKTVEVKRIIKE
jgi:hypothetical protein